MALPGFVRRNAFRSLRRSLLTVVSIAFSLLLLPKMKLPLSKNQTVPVGVPAAVGVTVAV